MIITLHWITCDMVHRWHSCEKTNLPLQLDYWRPSAPREMLSSHVMTAVRPVRLYRGHSCPRCVLCLAGMFPLRREIQKLCLRFSQMWICDSRTNFKEVTFIYLVGIDVKVVLFLVSYHRAIFNTEYRK